MSEKEELPKFISNIPFGVDKLEGKSANRVADAIKSHIELYKKEDKIPKIIGLDGIWGAGKSNIISILKNKLGNNYFLFEYDAWGYQEDLQRRSFLESLTTRLLDEKILEGDTTIKIKSGDIRKVSWDEKLKYLLAKKSEKETKSFPKVGYGVIVAFLITILTPICYFIGNHFFVTYKYLSLFITCLPIVLSLIIWAIAAFKNIKYRSIDFLLAIYQDKIIDDIRFETISDDEPSVYDFREWMKDVSSSLKGGKKLIIVFDNMDRLPREKVKQLWSSIHTFFADINGYDNIWVIIPFDKKHLANAFGEKDEKQNYELISHFINKTFPVIYRVPPPVMTDWKKMFRGIYSDAFGDKEELYKAVIERVFGIIKLEFTPRDIIAFINEIVSLKRIWKNDISLLHISVFVLLKDEILKEPVKNILSGSYLGNIQKIISNSETLQGDMASLVYGINNEEAKQIPLTQFLKESLSGNKNYDINTYSEHKYFVDVLEVTIRELEPVVLDKAILSMATLKLDLDITSQWNQLVNLQLELSIPKLAFDETYKILLQKASLNYKKSLVGYLCNEFREIKIFSGSEYYKSMKSFADYAKEYNINVSDYEKSKEVSQGVFIDYVNEAKENYTLFKLNHKNESIDTYCADLISAIAPKMDFISYLINNDKYDFVKVRNRIEFIINSNKINDENYAELLKAYKFVSIKKPFASQLNYEHVETLYRSISNKNIDEYYDVLSMVLIHQIEDLAYSEDLAEKIADRIEFYKDYGSLLLQVKDWGNELLKNVLNIITKKSYGPSSMRIEEILPVYNEIRDCIDVSDNDFLKRLNSWSKFAKEKISINNIATIINKYSFYNNSSTIHNDLTKFINSTAIQKLETIPLEELYSQRNEQTDYWINCASILIKNEVLENYPENLIEFCKKLIIDISTQSQTIPVVGSNLDIIINSADKNKLQPTVKNICVEFCNKTKNITPELFRFFAQNFDFINKMTSREDDITRNILNEVISDENCLQLILDNEEGYVTRIIKAGADAEDLKQKIRQLIIDKDSEKLLAFASKIGVEKEDEEEEK